MVKAANTTAASKSTKVEVPDDDDEVQLMDLQSNGEDTDGNVVVTSSFLKSLLNRISTLEKELKEVKSAVGLAPKDESAGTESGSANSYKQGSSQAQDVKDSGTNTTAGQKTEVTTPVKTEEKKNEKQGWFCQLFRFRV